MQAYLERWQSHAGEDAWAAEWWELSGQVAADIAWILGAAPESVALQPSATAALSTAVSCLDFTGPRRRIVTLARDFPSTGYFLAEQRRLGAEIVVLGEASSAPVSTGEIIAALDQRTALLACSHTSFLTSARLDATALVARAHQVGAMVLLDVYQSAGVVELDAAGWGVDFLIGGTIKWLCGGPACGYLYVRPDRIAELAPRHTGWIAHRNPFLFAAGAMDYAPNIRRFAQGTPNIPGLHSCRAGLALIREYTSPDAEIRDFEYGVDIRI
jgi:kynureninase